MQQQEQEQQTEDRRIHVPSKGVLFRVGFWVGFGGGAAYLVVMFVQGFLEGITSVMVGG